MRFVTFVLLAAFLTFPVLAVGDSIDFQGTGTLSAHTAFVMGSLTAGHSWEVGDQLTQVDDLTTGKNQVGNLGVFDITTGTLSKCAAGLCFSGGSLDIDNLQNKDLFFGALKSGTITMSGGKTILSAVLSRGASTVIRLNNSSFSSQALIQTHGRVVPEPTTLPLMGSGLIVLAGLWRKKKTPAQ